MARIFVVEDNEGLREAVVSYLRLADHEVVEFPRIEGVEAALATREPQLIVLDVMLPDGDGFQLARRLRKTTQVPVLFLTARTSESDRITGFELGADDYVVKPFSPKELVLRVEAILRRTGRTAGPGPEQTPLRRSLGERLLELDEASHRVLLDGRDLQLTAAEWRILKTLAARPEIVVSRERLLGESLEYLSAEGSERTVDTHVKNLRAKLGDPGWIETVRGFGYRFAGRPA
ncbi:MAG: response regulator transcription factor [Spirochaetales bacterium]|nr:response regulator transcription factor [Spirochaetales bacterium]